MTPVVTAVGGQAGGGFSIDRDLLCTADTRGYFVSLNAAWERTLGWSRAELTARPFIELVHPDDRARTERETGAGKAVDYELTHFENRFRTKDGGWRRLRWSARSDGRTWFAVAFDVTEEWEQRERLALMLSDDRLLAYSQPITNVRRAEGIDREELLARLTPERAGDPPIEPDAFIPAAEQLGLIGRVDCWMIERGIELAAIGRTVHVNLSPRTIEDNSVRDALLERIGALGEPATRLIFELTEGAAIEHLDTVSDFANRAVALGCRLAIDDWGTGYGSLSYLRELPFSYLKIDRSFVRDVSVRTADLALVRGVAAFAKSVGLRTIAEGVEDERTLGLLEDCGVDYVQGYLIGPPRPLAG